MSDPKDEMVLEAAINGRADALVTYNRRDFAAAAGVSTSKS
ncbi:PIN domain-containing protein [Mesorhizobium sp. M0088]